MDAPSSDRTALIVGAGIGGLAAGIALRRAGWRVRIFERRSDPRELGFALSLAPNAMAALRELGVADRIVAEGTVAGLTELRGVGGRTLKRFNVSAAPGQVPAVFARRQALHGALIEATDPRALSLACHADGFDVTRTGVVVRLADGRSEQGDLLVGADGVGSVIRKHLHPGAPPPRASGYYGLRGIAHDAARHLGDLTGAAYLAPGIEAATLKAGADAVYWYMSLLAGDVRDAKEEPRAIARRFAAGLDAGFRAILEATAAADIRLDALYVRDPIADWGRGVVTLLGDAAHPMLPHTGQGAAQALEDAVALGLAVAQDSDIAASLRRYERIRAARTRPIVLRGPRIARFTTTRSRLVSTARGLAIRLAPPGWMAGAFLVAGRPDPHAELRG